MSSLLHTPLCDKLHIDIPIVQAPIGGACTPELVAAVGNAGGFGIHPLSWTALDEIAPLIGRTRALTNKPFGANLVLEWDQHDRLAAALAAGVKAISFFWGDPTPYLAATRAAGAVTMLTVGSAAEARRARDLGIDIIVAQGHEAGGHVWGQVATMALVPAVVDAAAPLPVIAAGGIADGRGLAAALALGAAGAWMGTRFMASAECDSHDHYRERLIAAAETDTVHNTLFDEDWRDAPLRSLANSTWRNWVAAGRPARADRPGGGDILARRRDGSAVPRYEGTSPSRDMTGDLEAMTLYAGQSVGLVRDVKPAGEIVREIAADAARILARLGSGQS
jgi:NAD(P)H-dependent flavin oxidoreductase YrpB (nitropropane dioxygenase family)